MDLVVAATGDLLGMYSITATTVLLLVVKDRVLTVIYTLAKRIRILLSSTSREQDASYEEFKNKDSKLRLTVCREMSDMFVSQVMGWTTLIFVLSTHMDVFDVSSSTVTTTDSHSSITVFLVCIQVGRMFYGTYHRTFVDFDPVDLVHHVILTLSYAAFLLPSVGASTVALVAIASDIADFHPHLTAIMDIRGVPCYSKARIRVYIFGAVATLAGRCALPLTLIVAALTLDGYAMHDVTRSGLTLFCFFFTYLTTIHIFVGFTALGRFNTARDFRLLYEGAMHHDGKALELALSMKLQGEKHLPDIKKPMFVDISSITAIIAA